MPLAAIRAAVALALRSVSQVGIVTEYEPALRREEEFRAHFVDADLGYVLGWTVSRESTTEKKVSLATVRAEHLVVVRGYRALGGLGATEQQFQDLIETIRTRLREEITGRFGGAAKTVGEPQVRVAEPRTLGSYLVHYAELTITVAEEFPIPGAA